MDAVKIRTIVRVIKRLVPFSHHLLRRRLSGPANVSFAAFTMNQDLGLSQTAFGFGAGIFFISCFLFEVPSNRADAQPRRSPPTRPDRRDVIDAPAISLHAPSF
jgi:hypothetical protein